MIRFLVRTLILLGANAIGLLVASIVLDGVSINAFSFVLAVVLFTVVLALAEPFLANMLTRYGSAALGGVSLIATFVALLITNFISDGLSISGMGTWLGATVIVWAGALVAAILLPVLGLKKFLQSSRA